MAACSSGSAPAPPTPEGSLVAGTAQITVNDDDLGGSAVSGESRVEFRAVKCTPAGEYLTISTGTDQQGSTVVVSNADGLVAKSVTIHDLGNFTGSFNEGLGGKAEVSLNGATYTISGTAEGFNTDKPSFRSSGTFTIKAAC